jgi:hypothetical protein
MAKSTTAGVASVVSAGVSSRIHRPALPPSAVFVGTGTHGAQPVHEHLPGWRESGKPPATLLRRANLMRDAYSHNHLLEHDQNNPAHQKRKKSGAASRVRSTLDRPQALESAKSPPKRQIAPELSRERFSLASSLNTL